MAVTSADGKIELVSFKMYPDKLKYGDEATFEITLKNLVGSSINDFKAYMRLSYPIVSQYYSSWDTEPAVLYGNLRQTDTYNYVVDLSSISWAKNATKTFTGTFKFLPHTGIDLYLPDASKRFQAYSGNGSYNGLHIYVQGNYNSNTNYAFSSYFSNLENVCDIRFLDAFYEPDIVKFDAIRSNGTEINDEGTNLLLTILLNKNEKARAEIMSMHLYYKNSATPDSEQTRKDLTSYINAALSGEVQIVITDTFPTNADYDIYLWFGDQYESIDYPLYVSRAFANVHLSGKTLGGVCFGSFSKSTDKNPMFECYYPAKFFNGIEGGINYHLGERETYNRWIDGKPIYRNVVQINVTTTGSRVDNIAVLPAVDTLLNLHGCIQRSTSSTAARYPISFWYSTSNYHDVWMESSTSLSAKTSHAITGYVVLEYTKQSDKGDENYE